MKVAKVEEETEELNGRGRVDDALGEQRRRFARRTQLVGARSALGASRRKRQRARERGQAEVRVEAGESGSTIEFGGERCFGEQAKGGPRRALLTEMIAIHAAEVAGRKGRSGGDGGSRSDGGR